jgi:hypothetical protein
MTQVFLTIVVPTIALNEIVYGSSPNDRAVALKPFTAVYSKSSTSTDLDGIFSGFNEWVWLCIIGSSAVVLFIAIYGCVCCFKRGKQKGRDEAYAEINEPRYRARCSSIEEEINRMRMMEDAQRHGQLRDQQQRLVDQQFRSSKILNQHAAVMNPSPERSCK